MNSLYGGAPGAPEEESVSSTNPASISKKPGANKARRTRRSPLAPKILKNLDLAPQDKQSLREFVDVKKPSNLLEKCTVLTYYLINTLEVVPTTTDHIYTAFKTLGWRVPSNLPNTLQQAGSNGWLDTKASADIKTTPMGENLVEHDLPRPEKKK